MAVGTPEKATRVEDRIKIDVQREAPDSNPYLTVHWLRSLIAGIACRIFDFYLDLQRTETRLFPDTADDETALKWGSIFIGAKNAGSSSTGPAVATGVAGSVIGVGTILNAGSNEYRVTVAGTISNNVINASSLTRIGSTVTVVTEDNHNLSSSVPVTIAGADQTEYNVTDAEITVISASSFTYQIATTPVTPATGTITAAHTSTLVQIQGEAVNLDLDTPLTLQSPIVGVDNTLYVIFDTIGGGADEETTAEYKERYLEKIRNPVAHFNEDDIILKAKEVTGVTRVFVEPSNTQIGATAVTSITRNGNIATVVTAAAHGLLSGQAVDISGADQMEYNVTETVVLVEDTTTFHYIVSGSPVTPATGTITVDALVALGTLRIFFMRDNDDNPIPSGSEITTVKNKIAEIVPANTSLDDVFVLAPTAVSTDFIFTKLVPDTVTMRSAIEENLIQFFEENTSVGVSVDEDAYRAAIKNTVDPDTGDIVDSFELSAPAGDIAIGSGEIATKGTVTFSL